MQKTEAVISFEDSATSIQQGPQRKASKLQTRRNAKTVQAEICSVSSYSFVVNLFSDYLKRTGNFLLYHTNFKSMHFLNMKY